MKSRAPTIMRLIACLDKLPDESIGHILATSFGTEGKWAEASDIELVEQVERYVAHRLSAPRK